MPPTEPTPTIPPRKHHKAKLFAIFAVVAMTLTSSVAVFAALPRRNSGNIVIHVFDASERPNIPLDGVEVRASRLIDSPLQCSNSSAVTKTIVDPRNAKKVIHGAALFTSCPASGGKGVRYVIRGASKPGYRINTERSKRLNTGVFHLKSGSIRERTSIISFYMLPIRPAPAPSGPPPSPNFVQFRCGATAVLPTTNFIAIGCDDGRLSPGEVL